MLGPLQDGDNGIVGGRNACKRRAARAFSVSIESKRGSRFFILTRFLDANRLHFAGKRYSVTYNGSSSLPLRSRFGVAMSPSS